MRVIFICFLAVHAVFPIDVSAVLMPTQLVLIPLMLAPDRWLHALSEQRVGLCEVDDVKAHVARDKVFTAEKEPLQLVLAISIISHPNVKHFCVSLPDLV